MERQPTFEISPADTTDRQILIISIKKYESTMAKVYAFSKENNVPEMDKALKDADVYLKVAQLLDRKIYGT